MAEACHRLKQLCDRHVRCLLTKLAEWLTSFTLSTLASFVSDLDVVMEEHHWGHCLLETHKKRQPHQAWPYAVHLDYL